MGLIHPTAIIDPQAEVAAEVEIGPYVVIGGGVVIAPGCRVGPFCHFTGPTTVGADNTFISHCSVGAPPQDLSYRGEATRLEIGPGNTFREFVNLDRGSVKGGGVTRIGGHGLYMVGAHVAHDCQVGDHVIFANHATLAGHVVVGDHANIGAYSAVHQFCRVGEHAFLGGFTVATKDCLPYMKTVGARPARCFGPNSIGLQRKGFCSAARNALKRAWRLLHSAKLTTSEAIARIEEELAGQAEVDRLLAFIKASQRGVILSLG